jgi:hypothetical protein
MESMSISRKAFLTDLDLAWLVNYHALKDVACDYVKSRVASGGLTKPP